MMRCKLCDCEDVTVTYEGRIRNGKVGNYTNENVKMFRCEKCGTIWHDLMDRDYKEYYQRNLEGCRDIRKQHETEFLGGDKRNEKKG